MTPHRDPDRLVRSYLFEGAERLNDQVYDAVRAEIEHKRQRVVIGPWRMPNMSKFAALGLGAAAVVVALVVGTQLLGPPASGGVGATPSPTAAPSPTATPTPSAAAPSPSQPAAGTLPAGPFAITDQGQPITVNIPSTGWTFDPGFSVVGKGGEVNNLPEAALLLWSYPAGTGFDVYGDPCHWASTKPDLPATTVDEFAAALAAQPSRDASKPVDVTVGGHVGKGITLHVPDDIDFSQSSPCDEDNFASYGVAGDSGPSRYHQGPGQIDELWILDVDGATVVLDAMYRPDSRAELVEELRAIVESATFD
jgi:hypothetical protein